MEVMTERRLAETRWPGSLDSAVYYTGHILSVSTLILDNGLYNNNARANEKLKGNEKKILVEVS